MRVKKRCKVVPMPRIEIINTLHVPYHTLLHAVTSRYMPQYTRKSNFLTTTEGGRSTSSQSSPPTHQGDITRRQTQALQTHYIYNARTFPNPPYLTSTAQHGKNPAGWLEPQGWCSQSWHHRQGWQYSCWSLQFDRWCWYLLTTNGPSTCWQCAEHLPPKEDTATKRWLQQSLDAFLYHCAHKGTFNHRFSPWRSPLTENVDYTAREMQFRRTEQLRQRRQGSSSLAGRARHASPVHETVMYTRAGRS